MSFIRFYLQFCLFKKETDFPFVHFVIQQPIFGGVWNRSCLYLVTFAFIFTGASFTGASTSTCWFMHCLTVFALTILSTLAFFSSLAGATIFLCTRTTHFLLLFILLIRNKKKNVSQE
ncbi:hypothetical protein BDC45DRAFT_509057 [Circinella umbellata]|nr:hypothetical protein BDC45DRAFT_509057 [Circinella umbellata]